MQCPTPSTPHGRLASIALVAVTLACSPDTETRIAQLGADDPAQRCDAARALAEDPGDDPAQSFAALVQHSTDPDQTVRDAVREALAERIPDGLHAWLQTSDARYSVGLLQALSMRSDAAETYLATRLTEGGHTSAERLLAARLLGRVTPEHPAVADTLNDLYQNYEVDMRRKVLATWLDIGDTAHGIETALAAVEDPDAGVRSAARQVATELSLAHVDRLPPDARVEWVANVDPVVVDLWIGALESSEFGLPRRALFGLMALSELEGPRGDARKLAAELADDDMPVFVRAKACFELARLGEQAEPAFAALRTALDDRSSGVRALAAWALGGLGPRATTTRGRLAEMQSSGSSVERVAAQHALARIEGLAQR